MTVTSFWTRLALCSATPVLLYLSFPPADWGCLAWVANVPLLLYIGNETRRGRLFRWTLFSGFIYFLPSVWWIHHVSWAATFALGAYLAFYIPLFAALLRLLIPPIGYRFYFGVPIVYAACEHLRTWVITGFPWFYLGHTQHARLQLIQVLDLTGVPGLTFLVALANALAAGLVLRLVESGRAGLADKKWWGSLAGFLLLLGGTLGYGAWRLEGAKRVEGPEVGLVQGNIAQEVKDLREEYDRKKEEKRLQEWRETQEQLTDRLLEGREKPPDLIVWAETMYPEQFLTFRGHEFPPPEIRRRGQVEPILERLYEDVGKWRTWFLTGAETDEFDLEKRSWRDFNSAYLLSPQGVWEGRYDKIRLVVLGEYVPLVDDYPWIERAVKFVSGLKEISRLSRGSEVKTFALGSERFGTPICFEIMFPAACREFREKGATFLVTLSNDGWFQDSAELDQILAVTKLRAVENRIGIVRATNTGISAFVTPWGEAEEVLTVDGRRRGVAGTMCRRVLLGREETFYTRHGEWLGQGCVALVLLVVTLRMGGRLKWALIRRRASVGS